MNSSWLFRTHREGEARLRAEQNIFHVTVYGKKEEAVVKARPYCMQNGMEGEHAQEQTNIQTGKQTQVLMMALRLAGPQVPRSETKGAEPNGHKGPFFPPHRDRSLKRAVACFLRLTCQARLITAFVTHVLCQAQGSHHRPVGLGPLRKR